MSIATRLGRLTPALTPKEQVILVLRARKADEEPDPQLGRGLAEADRREYNRYIALLIAANNELGATLNCLPTLVSGYEDCARHVEVLLAAAAILEAEQGLQAPRKPPRDWRQKKLITVPELLRGLAGELRRDVADHVAYCWRELLALEAVWVELAAEFEGEDPLDPELRTTAEQVRASFMALAAGLGMKLPSEPDEAMLEAVRRLIDRPLGYLKVAGLE